MKKLLTVFILMFVMCFATSHTADAQVQHYRTTAFAYKQKDNNGNWTKWSDWEDSDLIVTIELTNDVIKIYSPKTQTYKVLSDESTPSDSSGKQVKFRVIDQDGDYGYVRLRIENNGNSQIYVDFANVMWVYNVKKD